MAQTESMAQKRQKSIFAHNPRISRLNHISTTKKQRRKHRRRQKRVKKAIKLGKPKIKKINSDYILNTSSSSKSVDTNKNNTKKNKLTGLICSTQSTTSSSSHSKTSSNINDNIKDNKNITLIAKNNSHSLNTVSQSNSPSNHNEPTVSYTNKSTSCTSCSSCKNNSYIINSNTNNNLSSPSTASITTTTATNANKTNSNLFFHFACYTSFE